MQMQRNSTPTVNVAHHPIPVSKVLTALSIIFLVIFIGITIASPPTLTTQGGVDPRLTRFIEYACVVLFLLTVTSCYHLLGSRGTLIALAIALPFGFFAEYTGVTYGWFFGSYKYTDLMGPKLGGVPLVVPPMWFSLTYIGSIIANLIVHKSPVDPSTQRLERFTISLLGAFIVTAYDLAADPFMIHIEAWIMGKKTGAYYGETVQGFVGWVTVSFIIMYTIRSLVTKVSNVQPILIRKIDSLMPVAAYFALMMTFVLKGHPKETRSVAVFAMGIPIIAALAGFAQWRITGGSPSPDAKK